MEETATERQKQKQKQKQKQQQQGQQRHGRFQISGFEFRMEETATAWGEFEVGRLTARSGCATVLRIWAVLP